MTPAEKQSRYRARQREAIEQLRQMAATASSAPQRESIGPNLGPMTPLTPDEVTYLRSYLNKYRAWMADIAAAQARRQAGADALSPEAKDKIKAQIAERKVREALLEATKPAAGIYWWVPDHRTEQIEIIIDSAGMPMWVKDGKQSKLDASRGRWQIDNLHPFYASKVEAEKYASEKCVARDSHHTPRPFKYKTDKELRRIRSANHPDKGGNHDAMLYQQAIEEIDHRRKG